MLNENRSHKQQHCLKGKGAGLNIMARIVVYVGNHRDGVLISRVK